MTAKNVRATQYTAALILLATAVLVTLVFACRWAGLAMAEAIPLAGGPAVSTKTAGMEQARPAETRNEESRRLAGRDNGDPDRPVSDASDNTPARPEPSPPTGGLSAPALKSSSSGTGELAPGPQALGYFVQAAPQQISIRSPRNTGPVGRKAIVVLLVLPAASLAPSQADYEGHKESQRRLTVTAGNRSGDVPPRDRCLQIDRRDFALRPASRRIFSSAGFAKWAKDGILTTPFIASVWHCYHGTVPIPAAKTVAVCWILDKEDMAAPYEVEFKQARIAVPDTTLTHQDCVAAMGSDFSMYKEFDLGLPDLRPLKSYLPPTGLPRLKVPAIAPRLIQPAPGGQSSSRASLVSRYRQRSMDKVPSSPTEQARRLWQLANNCLRNNMQAKGKEYLTTIVERYPQSEWATDAKARLAELE